MSHLTLINKTVLLFTLLFTSCNSSNNTEIRKYSIHEDNEFGHICVDLTIEDFMKHGFEFGDSCNIIFSNGAFINDIPFYDGYYAKTGDIIVIGYPGYEYLGVSRVNTSGFYQSFDFNNEVTVDIVLNEKAKYLDVQEALGIRYTDIRENYSSDEVFANYRNVCVGNIKENVLYRGASPVNNSHNRAKYVDNLLEQNDINYIIDLADTPSVIESYFENPDFDSPYAKSLYEDNRVACLGLSMGYQGVTYGMTIAGSIKQMIQYDGPYYFHCTEGKDRTGFFGILIEAFMGASLEELERDYMLSYDNYFGISKETNPASYNAIVEIKFQEFIDFFNDEAAVGTLTLQAKAYNYLKKSGLTDEELEKLNSRLSNN